MGKPRFETHMFEEPVETMLPKYKGLHRIHGVEYRRNPNGLGRKRYVYAIAEWKLPDSKRWHKMRDLLCQMRLANLVDHPFPKNTEHYANTC